MTDLLILLELVGGGGWADGYLRLVPVSVVLQGVEDVLGVGVDQVGPGLPQRVHDIIDKPHLRYKKIAKPE